MMKDFWLTFKFILKQDLSLKYVLHKAKEDKKARNMLIFMIVVFAMCIPTYATFIYAFVNLFKSFQALMMESLFIVMAIFVSLFMIVLFGMFQFIAYFYFSNDVRVLTPLPLKPYQYLISKFGVIYIIELLISALFVLPFFIIYGIQKGIFFYQWITMILAYLLMPIVPLVIVGIITILVMSLTNLFKSKDALRIIGYTVLFAFVIYFQIFIYQNLIPNSPDEQVDLFKRLAENSQYFLEKFAVYYPVSLLISYALSGTFIQAVLSVLGLGVICLGFIFLFSQFLQWVFVNSYLKEQDNPTKRKKVREAKVKGNGNVVLAIAKIDFFTLLKVPIYLFNTFAIVVIVPVAMIVSVGFTSSVDDASLSQIINFYHQYRNEFWLGFTLFLTILSTLVPIAATSFSREGKTNWIMRTLPITPRDHIFGRLFVPLMTQIFFNLEMIVIMLIVLQSKGLGSQETYINAGATLVISIIGSLPLLLAGLYVDLTRPMLDWDNPQRAIKQNMNVLISMGFGLVYGTVVFLVYRFILSYLPVFAIYGVYCIISVILTVILYRFVESNFNQKLIRM